MNGKLAALLAEVFNVRKTEVVLELTKDDVGSWDSLKQMDLVATLEREYDITLGIPDIVAMTSVRAIVDILKAKGVSLED